MKLRSLFAAALLVSVGVVVAPAAAGVPAPTTWAYPGPAPCDTTLQACVSAANAGDTIQIVENVPDPGYVSITKSLTIESDPTLDPPAQLGSAGAVSDLRIGSEDPNDLIQVDAAIRDLRTRDLRIFAYYPKGSGSTFSVTGMQMRARWESNGEPSVGLTAYAPITATIGDNVIEADGMPITVSVLPGGTAGFGVPTPGTVDVTVERNVVTTTTPLNQGIQVTTRPFEGSTAHVRVFDNLLAGLGGCNCGSAAGLAVRSTPPGAAAGVSVVDVWHNTVVRSGRGSAGTAPGMWLTQDVDTSLRVNLFDNIVALGNGPAFRITGDAGSPTVMSGFNDTFGNSEPSDWGGVAHQNHLSVDPVFVAAVHGDYRLAAGSPLIDAGAVCRPGGLGVLDVTGRGRLAGPTVDVGAYERGSVLGDEGVAIMGSSGEDLLTGTNAQDFLCGFGGVDEFQGFGGNDYLDGGKAPDDMVYGGAGADVVVTKDGWPGDLADGGKGVDLCRTDPDDVRVSC